MGAHSKQAPANVKPPSRRESGPVVDETAFQQLLSAAYVMQEHNSRLKKAPKPAAQAAAPVPAKPTIAVPTAPPSTQPIPFLLAPPQAGASNLCKECGAILAANEFFCEHCGAPVERTGSTTQKNWASLWEMHHASEPGAKVTREENQSSFAATKAIHSANATDEEIDLFPAELEEIVGKFPEPEAEEEPDTSGPEQGDQGLTLVTATAQPTASTNSNPIEHTTATWTSATKARAWLDSLKAQQPNKDWFREEWTIHRGAIYIALAAAVLLAVVFQSSSPPAISPGQPRQLSAFEQVLVSLGLAEAPPPPALTVPGNPTTKVWVDVHTALYYCPGADLYGKTVDGRYATQLDAQRDHFQPSTLKACD